MIKHPLLSKMDVYNTKNSLKPAGFKD